MRDDGKQRGSSDHNGPDDVKEKSRTAAGDEFSRAVSKIVVAQILESTGFHSSTRSSVDAIADLAIHYIGNLGKAATFYANLAGRSSCNVFDVVQGLQDFASSQGFSGASDVHRCLVSSSVIREIANFVSTKEEVVFARSIPRFPVSRSPRRTPNFVEDGEAPKRTPNFVEDGEAFRGNHVPKWLPSLPDPHTYVHTPVWNQRSTDPRADKVEQVRQRRKAEKSLLGLQQRLAFGGISEFSPVVDATSGKGKHVVGSNRFLAPPLPYGEKEVSEIAINNEAPADKRLSLLETFAPAIEAAKSGTLSAIIDEKRVLLSKRPVVHFKIGIDKKSVVVPLLSAAMDAKRDSWIPRDDEKDDKKRRAEMILKEAIENPQELTQL